MAKIKLVPTLEDKIMMASFSIRGFNWFAKDKNGRTRAFQKKPHKTYEYEEEFEEFADEEWGGGYACLYTGAYRISFLNWEDNEPYYFDYKNECQTIKEVIRGEWILKETPPPTPYGVSHVDFYCSVCKKFKFHNGEMVKKYLFCPHCGADMRKGEGE